MTIFVTAIFALTYVGMALGRSPGLKVDRSGIAMAAAVVLVAGGALEPQGLVQAIHFPTLLLLGGLMILSARIRAAGFYDAAAAWIAGRVGRPHLLLALTVAVSGALSALLVNDIVVFAMTPLLCTGLRVRGLDPRPFLVALAAASNAGSAATLIGNPQNIVIGQVGGLGFWSYLAAAALPAVFALLVVFAVTAFVFRRGLGIEVTAGELPRPAIERSEAIFCGLALVALLGLLASPLPREISALLVAATVVVSRTVPTRQLLGEIDLPLLILFAGLFVVNDAFAQTGFTEGAVRWLDAHAMLPTRIFVLAPLALLLSNTIGNVPSVVMILKVWHNIAPGTLTGLAILSTLAGNLLLIGSLANLIVAERASRARVRLSFRDHAKAGVPITLISMTAAALWLWCTGIMPL